MSTIACIRKTSASFDDDLVCAKLSRVVLTLKKPVQYNTMERTEIIQAKEAAYFAFEQP